MSRLPTVRPRGGGPIGGRLPAIITDRLASEELIFLLHGGFALDFEQATLTPGADHVLMERVAEQMAHVNTLLSAAMILLLSRVSGRARIPAVMSASLSMGDYEGINPTASVLNRLKTLGLIGRAVVIDASKTPPARTAELLQSMPWVRHIAPQLIDPTAAAWEHREIIRHELAEMPPGIDLAIYHASSDADELEPVEQRKRDRTTLRLLRDTPTVVTLGTPNDQDYRAIDAARITVTTAIEQRLERAP